jgi:hypothetical protein
MKKETPKQIQHSKPSNRWWTIPLVNSFFLVILFLFSLWWQDAYDLRAMADGIWLVFALQLTLSWSMFVYNKNIFTPLLHGLKTFFLIFIGKKPKEDYFTAYTKVLDHQIPKTIIVMVFFMTLFVFVFGVVLVVLAY